jgi:hypothetical protein
MAEKRGRSGRRSAREWQALLAEQAESGEETVDFCRRQGIHLATLRWWQWRLGVAGGGDRLHELAPATWAARTASR